MISNVLNSKVLKIADVPMTGGLLLFPITYLFSDALTEVYGYSESRKVIWTGLASLALLAAMIKVCGVLPADPSWPHQSAYQAILGRVPRIITASLLAYLLGEFTNAYVLAKSKLRTRGKLISLRFVLSTLIGQFVDTVVFVLIAFAGVISRGEIVAIALSGWIFKVFWEIIALPITIPLVNILKRSEHADAFDSDTDFSLLRI